MLKTVLDWYDRLDAFDRESVMFFIFVPTVLAVIGCIVAVIVVALKIALNQWG